MTKQPREKTAETLGANVRYLREHASISQTELARRMTDRGWSWHQSTVYRVETGKQPVRFDEAVDLSDLLGVTLDRLTWAIGEAAEEELATFAITSLRERMQEAAVAVARLRVARVVAERRAKSAADSDYPHIRELAGDIEEDLQSVNLGAVLELASILWRRYRQGIDTDPGDNAPIGGLKVASANGWFAARPSGTENIYKIYAESFKDQAHLNAILSELKQVLAVESRAGMRGDIDRAKHLAASGIEGPELVSRGKPDILTVICHAIDLVHTRKGPVLTHDFRG